jgi:diguanylate cyclase (GGDEF)-like protein
VGHLLDSHLRDGDLVARYGGEEFLFCFLGLDERAAARTCEELRIAIERADWSALSPGLRVTMSVGVACSEADPDAASLLEQADACLYRAKRLGRNRVEIGTYRRPTAA